VRFKLQSLAFVPIRLPASSVTNCRVKQATGRIAQDRCRFKRIRVRLSRRRKFGGGRRLPVDGFDLYHLNARAVRIEEAHLSLIVDTKVDLHLTSVALSCGPCLKSRHSLLDIGHDQADVVWTATILWPECRARLLFLNQRAACLDHVEIGCDVVFNNLAPENFKMTKWESNRSSPQVRYLAAKR
jgi:hypothetical protein